MANNSCNVYFATNISQGHFQFKLSFQQSAAGSIWNARLPWVARGPSTVLGRQQGYQDCPPWRIKYLYFVSMWLCIYSYFVFVFEFCNCVFVCPSKIDSTVPNPTNLCYPALIEVFTPSASFSPLIPTLGQRGQALTSSVQRPGHFLFIVVFHVSFYFEN